LSAAVVDSSIALSWCFVDEASAATNDLLDRVRDNGAAVPGLWHLEVANVLVQAERRGRISKEDVAVRLALIDALPIVVDPETPRRAWREILALARIEGLTTYDAAYLELALRLGVPLWTKDKDLARAAERRGVAVRP
jgi:predicted nucleic acid-binding protein